MLTKKNVSFNVAIDEYLKYLKLKNKNSSYTAYKYRMYSHILPYVDNKNIFTFTKKDYLNWQYKIEELSFKYNYKSSLHCLFAALLNYCIIYYDLPMNVAKIVGNFKNNDIPSIGSIWSYKEFTKFIDCIDNQMYYVLFNLLYFTGMRKGELLSLKWIDIDFNNKTLSINKTISKELVNYSHIITTPKTKSSVRKIALDNNLIKLLYNYYLDQKNYYNDFDNNNFIFGYYSPISFNTLMRRKNYYCDKANVKRIKIHEFRHSHACLLFDKQVPIDEISSRLGHAHISMTTDIYLKYLPKQEKRTLEALNSLKINHTFYKIPFISRFKGNFFKKNGAIVYLV